ncbi:cytochrome c biogenesis protein ResB [Brevibacillus fluminis]|uniref:cytochrome c biogenesis protein ResB n=1 Tax=Brevibacillus fluminis TaxID=511487 RepID=UPI003F8888C6
MDDRKCACGHPNPIGTQLCESCGRPLESELEQANENAPSFPDMRYEGMARRSQTYSSTIIDKTWNFFSSVKVAIYIILVTLIASAIGTIFPQKMYIPVPVPLETDVQHFYETTYGWLGKVYYALGFHELYSSWWFVTLLVMLGTSLVICSLDRIIPLYKALSKPRLNQHASFLRGQRMHAEVAAAEAGVSDDTFVQASAFLKKKGYRVFREGDSLLAEKARFSRWGPYINHIGLIIFLGAVLVRNVPGFYLDNFIWVREGQTVPVPDTPYYVKNLKYTTEYYSEDEMAQKLDLKGQVIPKNFQTDAILYLNKNAGLPGAKPKLEEVKRGPIIVNHPMEYEGLLLYQSSRQEMMLGALNFELLDKQAGNKAVGSFKIDLYDPPKEVKLDHGVVIRVLDYYPDFFMDETTKKPATKTSIPNNPMVAFEVMANGAAPEKMVYVSGSVITQTDAARYTLDFHKPDLINISGLNVRRDTAIPYIYFGCVIFIIGVAMGSYWQHRRIWLQVTDAQLHVAAHTNKNWFGITKELEALTAHLGLPVTFELKAKKNKE